jgi:hypothetical protein
MSLKGFYWSCSAIIVLIIFSLVGRHFHSQGELAFLFVAAMIFWMIINYCCKKFILKLPPFSLIEATGSYVYCRPKRHSIVSLGRFTNGRELLKKFKFSSIFCQYFDLPGEINAARSLGRTIGKQNVTLEVADLPIAFFNEENDKKAGEMKLFLKYGNGDSARSKIDDVVDEALKQAMDKIKLAEGGLSIPDDLRFVFLEAAMKDLKKGYKIYSAQNCGFSITLK